MKKLWLVTGTTGHVGTILVSVLQQRGEHVRALVRPNSSLPAHSNVEICEGDIRDRESLKPFFDRGDYDYVSLVHCAALITIASKHNPEVWNINVHGTNNVMSLPGIPESTALFMSALFMPFRRDLRTKRLQKSAVFLQIWFTVSTRNPKPPQLKSFWTTRMRDSM